jgi:hypothetical protein
MPLVQTSPPAIEPVTLSDVYLQSRIIDSSEDVLLTLLIGAARRYAEMYTGRSFITQSWRLVLDSFPGMQMGGYAPFGAGFTLPGNAILLSRGLVQSVSITYTAMDGNVYTVPTTDYVAELSGDPARLAPVFGKIWPIPLPQIGAVKIDYVAGYGLTAASVPEGIRQWILLRVATLYENREEVAVLKTGKIGLMPYVDSLLDPYMVVTA